MEIIAIITTRGGFLASLRLFSPEAKVTLNILMLVMINALLVVPAGPKIDLHPCPALFLLLAFQPACAEWPWLRLGELGRNPSTRFRVQGLQKLSAEVPEEKRVLRNPNMEDSYLPDL